MPICGVKQALRRREHVFFAMILAAVGVAGAALVSEPILVLGLLCLSQIGVSATPPLLWPIPSAFLTGSSAAAGIAAINAIGNLSGFAGPYVMGYLKDATGNFSAGLLILAGCTFAGGLVALTLKVSRHLETVEPTQLAPAA
jgi:cyanate permease